MRLVFGFFDGLFGVYVHHSWWSSRAYRLGLAIGRRVGTFQLSR